MFRSRSDASADQDRPHSGGRVRRALASLSYWPRLAMLTLYGPATQDAEHDPVVALKREHGRHLASWEESDEVRKLSREEVTIDIRETPAKDLGRVWPEVEQVWGEEASRIWQEALSAEDASET